MARRFDTLPREEAEGSGRAIGSLQVLNDQRPHEVAPVICGALDSCKRHEAALGRWGVSELVKPTLAVGQPEPHQPAPFVRARRGCDRKADRLCPVHRRRAYA